MRSIEDEIYDCIDLLIGNMTSEEFNKKYPTLYKLTNDDIKDMQNDADRELFGSGCRYI